MGNWDKGEAVVEHGCVEGSVSVLVSRSKVGREDPGVVEVGGEGMQAGVCVLGGLVIYFEESAVGNGTDEASDGGIHEKNCLGNVLVFKTSTS